ncbi:hypothetical protein TWF506_006318 [Arthrobotrys conoides]|uniref:Uncharacterized protein n=1 Tax=Arthrobotrys conoides TaxID=74498 RepID=A0AAN8RNX2_9PEZI
MLPVREEFFNQDKARQSLRDFRAQIFKLSQPNVERKIQGAVDHAIDERVRSLIRETVREELKTMHRAMEEEFILQMVRATNKKLMRIVHFCVLQCLGLMKDVYSVLRRVGFADWRAGRGETVTN